MNISGQRFLLDHLDADLDKPTRRLDRLLVYICSQDDADELIEWFIETLADERNTLVVIDDSSDPVRNIQDVGDALADYFSLAGQSRWRRHRRWWLPVY